MYNPYPGGKQPYLTVDQCRARYPRLTRCLQWVLIGSSSEAAACIRDYRCNLSSGSEAVSHSGLSPADRIQHAVSIRHTIRRTLGGAYAVDLVRYHWW